MRKIIPNFSLAVALLASSFTYAQSPATALTPAQQNLINMAASGHSNSIKQAAENVSQTGEASTQVLDVLAEVLLQNTVKSDGNYVDALAWICKALGNSGQAQYYDALHYTAINASERKLRKYAEAASKQLHPTAETKQYVKGNVSLETAQATAANTTSAAQNAVVGVTPIAGAPAPKPLSAVKVGMSMEAVYALIGLPTNTNEHETGKRWIPFNFKGGDVRRNEALYKGQGRVIFANQNAYNMKWEVIEVQINPNESGYP